MSNNGNKDIHFRARYQHFQILLYPDCKYSKLLMKIIGKPCINGIDTLHFIYELGFNVHLIPDSNAIIEEMRNKKIDFNIGRDSIEIK